jgi:hypothetical protein
VSKPFTAAAVALTLLVGTPIVESLAESRLRDSVHTAVTQLVPGTGITRIEPRGRPYLLSLLGGHEVSTAYVDLDDPAGSRMILQRLNRDTGKVGSLLWFSDVKQSTPLQPVLLAEGVDSSSGTTTLDGETVTVTYTATVTGHTLQVRPKSVVRSGKRVAVEGIPAQWRTRLTPKPVSLPKTIDLSVRAVTVGADDITVELRAENVDAGQAG